MNIYEHFQTLSNPSHYKFAKVDCYLCGEDDPELLLVGEEDLTGKEGSFQYVRCRRCGLSYQNPRIHEEQIGTFYDNEYIAHRKKKDFGLLTPLYEQAMSKHDREKEKLVRSYVDLDHNSRVLDVGCAVGTFLLHIKDKYDCFVSGVDFKNDFDFPRFEEVDFHHGFFYEQQKIEPKSYDLITMWHFLEHCYDPIRSLRKAKELLSEGGRLVVEVPRLDSVSYTLFKDKWPGVQAPQHTVMFDKEHLFESVKRADLKVVDYLPYGAFPSYFYLFAGSYFRLFGKGLDIDKMMAPYFVGQVLMSPLLAWNKKLNLAMQTIVCEV